MTRRARAAIFSGGGRISLVDRHYPEPGDGQLLLRVEANALCGTDRHQYDAGSAVVPGHETVGRVAAVGGGVTTALGTRGVVYLMDFCGRCRNCRGGHTNQCLAKRADRGLDTDGGYGGYELVSESQFFPVPDDLPAPTATLLLDTLGTTGHALSRLHQARDDVASLHVAGAGPIGLGTALVARIRLGAEVPIYVSDISPARRALAAALGAQPVDAGDPDAVRRLPLVDAAIDTSGRRVARQAALDRLGARGVLVCVGHGEDLLLQVSADLIAPERSVLGSEYFRFDELPATLELLQAHRAEAETLITHVLPIESIGEAFSVFLSGQSGKVVVTQEPR